MSVLSSLGDISPNTFRKTEISHPQSFEWLYHKQLIGYSSLDSSDFPPPTDFPNFMHNSKMIKYLDMYADKFGMRKYIKVRHEVLSVKPCADYAETCRWEVKVKNLNDGEISENVYDGIMVCTGTFIIIRKRTIPC